MARCAMRENDGSSAHAREVNSQFGSRPYRFLRDRHLLCRPPNVQTAGDLFGNDTLLL